MPSRRTVALALLFWLLTTSYVAYRDLWPRLFVSGPPPVAIDLADEATQTVPVRWLIYRGDQKIGSMTSWAKHVDTDDTFWFMNEYKELTLEAPPVKGVIPELRTGVRITRGGDLLEQSLKGKLEAYILGIKVEQAEATIKGKVIDGQLIAHCDIQSALSSFEVDLEPVPVPQGQPLNPLQPVNRLLHVKPGRNWYIRMTSPLDDAILAVARKKLAEVGVKLREEKREPLFAQVLSDAETLAWHGHIETCWVIEYRQEKLMAKTWVRVSDGRVLKQQAYHGGEQLTIEREE